MPTDFEKRYSRKPVKIEGNLAAEMRTASQNLIRRLRTQLRRPDHMAYYEGILGDYERNHELFDFKGKVVGTYCAFAPEELILAAGALPVRLCSGYSETVTVSEELLPRDICPLAKSSFGFALLSGGSFDACDVLVLPTTCDAKKKMGEYLSDYKPVWTLHVPAVKNYAEVKDFWLQEVKRFKTKLETLTGNKITVKSLKAAVELLKKRSMLFRRLHEIRVKNPGVISQQDWLMVIQSTFFDDPGRWIERTGALCQQLAAVPVGWKSTGKKLLLTGAPVIWPNFKILNVLSELDGWVVADDMCSGTQRLWDYAEPDEWTMEGMLEAVAARYLFPSVCPCFTSSYDRIDKILKLAEEFKVDGVIYHDLRLCQLFDMERDLVNKVLKEKKIPMLTLHTDYGQEDVEQIRTRAEAFLEMIR